MAPIEIQGLANELDWLPNEDETNRLYSSYDFHALPLLYLICWSAWSFSCLLNLLLFSDCLLRLIGLPMDNLIVDFYQDCVFCWGDIYVGGGVIPLIYTVQYTFWEQLGHHNNSSWWFAMLCQSFCLVQIQIQIHCLISIQIVGNVVLAVVLLCRLNQSTDALSFLNYLSQHIHSFVIHNTCHLTTITFYNCLSLSHPPPPKTNQQPH